MRMLSGLGVSCLVLATALAVGCDDEGSSSDQQGGAGSEEGGSANESGSGGKGSGGTNSKAGESGSEGGEPTMSEAGSGGSSTMGGDSGGGGVPTSSGGEGGGGSTPVDTGLCENFPTTVELGPTIGLGQKGAIICLDPCRVTSNTYSDGDGACSNDSPAVRFFTDSGQGGSYYANLSTGLEWDSASAGEINQEFSYVLQDVPVATEITAVITAGNAEYTVVFEFDDLDHLTITSFSEN